MISYYETTYSTTNSKTSRHSTCRAGRVNARDGGGDGHGARGRDPAVEGGYIQRRRAGGADAAVAEFSARAELGAHGFCTSAPGSPGGYQQSGAAPRAPRDPTGPAAAFGICDNAYTNQCTHEYHAAGDESGAQPGVGEQLPGSMGLHTGGGKAGRCW